jgi:DNA-binding IclR family transcriptional regulator
MVSDTYLQLVKGELSTEPIPLRALAERLEKPETSLLRVLQSLEALGLAAQVDLPNLGWRAPKKGWIKNINR